MTTISVSDRVSNRIEQIRDAGEHSSKDSAIRSLLRAYDRVDELERQLDAQNTLPHDADIVDAYTELGLTQADPVPDAVLAQTRDTAITLFRLYAQGPWTYNAHLAREPPWLEIATLPSADQILVTFCATGSRDTDADSPVDGLYAFLIPKSAYEDQLCAILNDSAVAGWLAPPDGVPYDVELPIDGEMTVRPAVGGWGRAISSEEASLIFDRPTIADAIEDGPDAETRDHPNSESGVTEHGIRIDDPADVRDAFEAATDSSLTTDQPTADTTPDPQ